MPYEVREASIYVDGGQRDAVRMALATEGLPASGPAGYELLDNLSGFGTTSQMFDAAYWRAKEGELARTITAAPNVRAARVHLANPVNQPFARTPSGTASVTVTMARGALDAEQAQAIRYLVSSAVAGLAPEAVAVIDSRGRRAAGGRRERAVPGGHAEPDRPRRDAARERAAAARGAGRARQGDRRGQRRQRHGQRDDHRARGRPRQPGRDLERRRGEPGDRPGRRDRRDGRLEPARRRRERRGRESRRATPTPRASGRTSRSARPGASG